MWWRDLSPEEKAAVKAACPDKDRTPIEYSGYSEYSTGYEPTECWQEFSSDNGEWSGHAA